MDCTRDGLGAMDEWWTLGEASERANVSHMALQVWINSGQLTCDLAWREGVSVRVVRSAELAALVPGLSLDAAGDGASLKDRALHRGAPHATLGSDAPPESVEPPPSGEGEESHEAELRREVTRTRGPCSRRMRSASWCAAVEARLCASPSSSGRAGGECRSMPS